MTIIGGYFPIEKRLFAPINFLMPEFYTVKRYTVIEQIKEASCAVFIMESFP